MPANGNKFIYFITGASGVGKTTLVDQMKEKYHNKPWAFLHFDSIGIPSVDDMIKEFGSPSGWQEAKTHEWIERLIHGYDTKKIFMEGQVNLQFIRNGFLKHHFNNYRIILIDCNEVDMEKRLVHDRKQPELFNPDMKNWLRFLRAQAKDLNVTVIENSGISTDELRNKFENAIELNSKS